MCSRHNPNWTIRLYARLIVLFIVLGAECFYQFVSGLLNAGAFDAHQLPMCFSCMSEILNRENMGLVYDTECSFLPNTNWFETIPYIAYTSSSCMRNLREAIDDTSVQKVPVECIFRQTGAGLVPPGFAEILPSYCNTTIAAYSQRLGCCSRIMNTILHNANLIAGGEGFSTENCVATVLDVTFVLSGLKLGTAKELVSDDVLGQLSADELAHFVPALLLPEFIRNIRLVQSSTTTRSDVSVDVNLEFEVCTQENIFNNLM